MSIESISLNLSNKLGDRLNKTDEEKAVLNYGLFVTLHTLTGILVTILVGILSGKFVEIMTIFIISSWLKRYTGGVHSSTPRGCTIIGTILVLLLSILSVFLTKNMSANNILILSILILVFAYYMIYTKCPVPSKNKPFKKESTRKKLRKKALNLMNVLLGAILFLYIIYIKLDLYIVKTILISILLGIGLQISVLTNVGMKFIGLLDKTLDFPKKL